MQLSLIKSDRSLAFAAVPHRSCILHLMWIMPYQYVFQDITLCDRKEWILTKRYDASFAAVQSHIIQWRKSGRWLYSWVMGHTGELRGSKENIDCWWNTPNVEVETLSNYGKFLRPLFWDCTDLMGGETQICRARIFSALYQYKSGQVCLRWSYGLNFSNDELPFGVFQKSWVYLRKCVNKI